MDIQDMIEKAGWWLGTEREWQQLSEQEREDRAFAATGSEIAYPTWRFPTDCWHTQCLIRRGKLPAIALTNHQLQTEIHNGWLRFHKDSKRGRSMLAKLCRAVRNQAVATGEYDIWKMPGGWQTIVGTGVTDL